MLNESPDSFYMPVWYPGYQEMTVTYATDQQEVTVIDGIAV